MHKRGNTTHFRSKGFKTMLNSVVSIPGARYMVADTGHFYLVTYMEHHKHMRISTNLAPQAFNNKYDFIKSDWPKNYWKKIERYQLL